MFKFLIPALLISGCVTTQQLTIDYKTVAVPEEGGMSFIQYTRDDDNIKTPTIRVVVTTDGRKNIEWWAAPVISLSNDGELISYIASQNNTWNIFIRKTSGGGSTVQRTFRTEINDMAFSPDGKHIAFSDVSDGNSNVYMINSTEGAAIQQITSTSSHEVGPCFSPDGNLIYFTKYETTFLTNGTSRTSYYVWSFNRHTSLLTEYSEGFTPTLTPDGNHLIITRNNKETNFVEIWMVDIAKGTSTLLLSDKERGFSSPQVSPDGKKIVCVGISKQTAVRPTNLDLYTFNIDGTNLTQITFHGGHDLSPKWSPDGNSIYFLSQRGSEKGKFNVWKISNL